MLKRILEPELMDTPEEARDYDAMEHAEVNHRFADDFLSCLARASRPGWIAKNDSLRMLDLGTGTALIPIEVCRRAENISIVAVDAAHHMLELAQRNIDGAAMGNRIHAQLADAKSLPFGDSQFDGVISNSIVHHLAEPMIALREAVRVTKSGVLFFRDLLRPGTKSELSALVDLYAPGGGLSSGAEHQRAMFAASLHAALTLDEIRKIIAELDFPTNGVQQTSDRHWTWFGETTG